VRPDRVAGRGAGLLQQRLDQVGRQTIRPRPVGRLHQAHRPAQRPGLVRELPAQGGLADPGRSPHESRARCAVRARARAAQRGDEPRQLEGPADQARGVVARLGDALAIERLHLRPGLHAQRLPQVVAQVAVPAQRGRAPTRCQLGAHQRQVCRLVARLFLRQPFQLARRAQQAQVLVAQPLARRFGPGLVAGPGRQVAAIQLRGRAAGLRIATGEGGVRGALEALRIAVHRVVRQQEHAAAEQHDGVDCRRNGARGARPCAGWRCLRPDRDGARAPRPPVRSAAALRLQAQQLQQLAGAAAELGGGAAPGGSAPTRTSKLPSNRMPTGPAACGRESTAIALPPGAGLRRERSGNTRRGISRHRCRRRLLPPEDKEYCP